jgi:hypothetical protein
MLWGEKMKKILIVAAILFVVANVAAFSVAAYEESNRILENELNPADFSPGRWEELQREKQGIPAEEPACLEDGKLCEEVEQ